MHRVDHRFFVQSTGWLTAFVAAAAHLEYRGTQVCVLQQRHGLSTGLASAVSSSKTATLTRRWKATQARTWPSVGLYGTSSSGSTPERLCCATKTRHLNRYNQLGQSQQKSNPSSHRARREARTPPQATAETAARATQNREQSTAQTNKRQPTKQQQACTCSSPRAGPAGRDAVSHDSPSVFDVAHITHRAGQAGRVRCNTLHCMDTSRPRCRVSAATTQGRNKK